MGRLRFSSKFLLTGLIFTAALAYFSWHVMSDLDSRVRQIDSELAGNELIGDLVQWNKDLIEYRRIATTAAPNDAAVKDRLKQHEAVIEKTLQKLESDAQKDAPLFDAATGVKDIRAGWSDLEAKVMALPIGPDFAQSAFAAHGKEFDRLYAFMHVIGDNSQISFEPDTDLFYLGFPLANNTPKVAGITVRIYAYQILNLSRGTLTPKDRVFYEVTEARLQDVLNGVETMLSQSMKSNPDIKARMDQAFSQVKSATGALLKDARQNFIAADSIGVTQQQVTDSAKPAIDAAWGLIDENRKIFEERLLVRQQTVRAKFWGMLAINIVVVLVSIYLFVGMYLSIADSVERLTDGAARFASGDFTRPIVLASNDELSVVAQRFSDMSRALSTVVSDVKQSAQNVLASSKTLSEVSKQIADGSRAQSEAAQATAASVEEVSVTVSHVAENVNDAVQISEAASQAAVHGRARITEAVNEIRAVADSVQEVTENVTELGKRTEEIGAIVSTIKDIADQTNLLALNAAIEAARAGESGRGFAVVADEVRKLAENTRNATESIASMIGKIRQGVELSIKQASNSREQVLGSVGITESAALTLGEIQSSAERTLARITEISGASREQATATQGIAQHIEHIAHMADRNDQTINEVSSAAQRLKELAESLNGTVAAFKLPA
jgi:methyl-accepting chemotaxis protein